MKDFSSSKFSSPFSDNENLKHRMIYTSCKTSERKFKYNKEDCQKLMHICYKEPASSIQK